MVGGFVGENREGHVVTDESQSLNEYEWGIFLHFEKCFLGQQCFYESVSATPDAAGQGGKLAKLF